MNNKIIFVGVGIAIIAVIITIILFNNFAGEIPFITTWNIDNDSNRSLVIPTTGTGYNYTIDWGDGTIDTGQTGNANHTYESIGVYTVSISGDFPRIYLHDSNSAEKLVSVDQWGDIEWTSMSYAFSGARNMNVIATDVPDLSRVTDMSFMFSLADSFNGDIGGWDTSNVTDMFFMFYNAHSFNRNIGGWDTSSVTDMGGLFDSTDSFNGNIGGWDTSSVIYMDYMFFNARSFNGNIAGWDTSNVIFMNYMFNNANSFNHNIGGWNTTNVIDMNHMFNSANSFDGSIIRWDTSNVTDMSFMFFDAGSFNGDISKWNVSSVTDMSSMLTNTLFSTINYDKILDSWSKLPTLQNNVRLDSSSKYCASGEAGRINLIDIHFWSIIDAGIDVMTPPC